MAIGNSTSAILLLMNIQEMQFLAVSRLNSLLIVSTVTTVNNVEMLYTVVMVPTIALYHSGVGAVVSPVSFFISPSYV